MSPYTTCTEEQLDISHGMQDLFTEPHYEYMPIQVYRTFQLKKNKHTFKFSDKKKTKQTQMLFIFLPQNIDCGYPLEPPQQGGSNEYPQSVFSSKNKKKNMYTPVNPSSTI